MVTLTRTRCRDKPRGEILVGRLVTEISLSVSCASPYGTWSAGMCFRSSLRAETFRMCLSRFTLGLSTLNLVPPLQISSSNLIVHHFHSDFHVITQLFIVKVLHFDYQPITPSPLQLGPHSCLCCHQLQYLKMNHI